MNEICLILMEVITFYREKMAFFTRVNMTIPLLPTEINELNQTKKESFLVRPLSQSGEESQKRFEYTVDPELGVQV